VQKHPTPSAQQSSTKSATYHQADLPPLLQRALETAVAKSAKAPVILNVTDITGYTDWVLIVSGRSDRQVQAIAEAIVTELEADGARANATDGGDHTWDLLDYDDFMVHVFYHPVRMHFDLESMWSDAPRVELDVPDDVMDTTELDTLAAPNTLPAYRGDLIFGGYDDEFAD
jgi:ribosome silencing factor RsfS/YbeB/iojap